MFNGSKKKIKDFLYEHESYLIGDACREVWKKFGGAFKEKIVDKALTVALQKRGLLVEDQKEIPIYFSGVKVGNYRPDKIVNKVILIEIKCKPYITHGDERQFWYYLKASNYSLGFLINFSPTKIELRRRIYDKARKSLA
jgi:GxxExxY protein